MATDWVLPAPKTHCPCDFRMFLNPGAARQRRGAFLALSATQKNAGLANKDRATFVRALLKVIRAESQRLSSATATINKVTKFFRWADSAGADISLNGAVPLLRQYKNDMSRKPLAESQHVLWFVKRVARILGRDERGFLIELFGRTSSDWIIDVPRLDPPYFDLRALTSPAKARLTHREFSRLPEFEKKADTGRSDRTSLIRALLTALLAAQQRLQADGMDLGSDNLIAAWQLVRFMDDRGLRVSRSTLFKYLEDGSVAPSHFGPNLGTSVLRVLSWIAQTGLERSAVAAARAQRSAYKQVANDSEWALSLPDRNPARVDLRILIAPGSAKLAHSTFIKLADDQRESLAPEGPRKELVRTIGAAWTAELVQGGSCSTVHRKYAQLKAFFAWCDARSLAVDPDSIIDSLTKYSVALAGRARAGRLKHQTAKHILLSIAGTVATALDTTSSFIVTHLAAVDAKGGGGRMGRYVAASDTHGFMDVLEAIIDAITVEVVDGDSIDGVSVQHAGGTIVIDRAFPTFRGRIPDRFLNSNLVQLRITAELLRFIALTGANKSVALRIRRTAVDWSLDQRGYRLKVFKGTKGGLVTLVVPKWYRSRLERHIDFVASILGTQSGKVSSPLFPRLVTDTVGNMRSALVRGENLSFRFSRPGTDVFATLRDLCRASGIRFLTAQDLRFGLGDYRHAAHNGDSLRASQALGNSPSVARKSYGGSGNLFAAQREMTRFWGINESLQLSIDTGLCASFGVPKALNDHAEAPQCGTENACFGCDFYRGIEHPDYIALMLTREEELRIRAKHEPARAQEFTTVIDYIQPIVQSYLERNPEQAELIATTRERVRCGDYHPSLKRHIEIYRRLHAVLGA